MPTLGAGGNNPLVNMVNTEAREENERLKIALGDALLEIKTLKVDKPLPVLDAPVLEAKTLKESTFVDKVKSWFTKFRKNSD